MDDAVWRSECSEGMGKVKLFHDTWALFWLLCGQKLLWVSSLLNIQFLNIMQIHFKKGKKV